MAACLVAKTGLAGGSQIGSTKWPPRPATQMPEIFATRPWNSTALPASWTRLPVLMTVGIMVAMDEGDTQTGVKSARRLQDLPEWLVVDVDVTDKGFPCEPC